MIRRVIGGLLVALPLAALFALYAAANGWVVALVTWLGGFALAAAIAGGLYLLAGGDR